MPPRILFLCVANSARSQMAEALCGSIFGDRVAVRSAGSVPTLVNPLAVEALSEIGIEWTNKSSDAAEDVPADEVDVVVTLCAEEVCPVFLGDARRLHWPIPDPASDDPDLDPVTRLQRFRKARDTIRQMLTDRSEELGLGAG